MILQICEVKSEKNLLLGKGNNEGSKILALSSFLLGKGLGGETEVEGGQTSQAFCCSLQFRMCVISRWAGEGLAQCVFLGTIPGEGTVTLGAFFPNS